MTKNVSLNKTTFTTMGASIYSNYNREAGDFYATNPRAIDALECVGKLPKNNKIWECAAGQGDLSKALIQKGYEVISTDLYDRGYCTDGIDFLQTDRLLAPCILTNPPYNLATEFCIHAIALGADEIYMFVKLQFLEGQRRYNELYSKNPPSEILQFIERMTVARNGNPSMYDKSSAIAFCWMIWEKNHIGEPKLSWITANPTKR